MVGAESSRDIGPGYGDEDTRTNCDSDLRAAKTERKDGGWRTAGVSHHSESKKTKEEEEEKDRGSRDFFSME